jgi:hypothetical protein
MGNYMTRHGKLHEKNMEMASHGNGNGMPWQGMETAWKWHGMEMTWDENGMEFHGMTLLGMAWIFKA